MTYFEEDKIVNANAYKHRRCKATIQKSGKLGFSAVAAELMGLAPDQRFLVSEIGDGNYAVAVLPDSTDERGFIVRKSVNYFTVDMKAFFDQKGIDYRREDASVIYDIVPLPEEYQGHPVFKMTMRVRPHRKRIDRHSVEGKDGAAKDATIQEQ